MPIPFTSPVPAQPGMGAIVQNGGVLYRLWAPFASAVTLWGDFFNAANLDPIAWDALQLQRDDSTGDGATYWSAFVPGAKADSLYKYQIACDGSAPLTHVQTLWKHDPYARDAVSFDGNSVVVDRDFDWTGDDFQMPPWNELVIYELHIGSFYKTGPGGGTFDNTASKLQYLADLGINAIEIMPAFDFDTPTSLGYNTGLPFAMDNAYGNLKTMKQLIKAAHLKGIAVILDVAYNHFGPQGLDQCLRRIDGYWKNDTQGEYFYDDIRIWTPYGDNRPDYGRTEVRWYLRNHAMTCLQEFHADGLRLDSVIAMREAVGSLGVNGDLPDGWSLLKWIGEEKRNSQSWKILIAEDLQNDSWITRDALSGGMGLDAQWDSNFLGNIRSNTILAPSDSARSATAIAYAISNGYSDQSLFSRIVYAESHDEANSRRLPDLAQPGDAQGWYARKLSTLCTAIALTSPGIPMLFMGQEFLEWQPWTDSADASPMDWSRTTTCGGILALYTRLIHLRRNWDNNTRGLRASNLNVFHTNEAAGVVAFHRWDQGGPGDDVVVVLCLKNQSLPSYNIGFPRPGTWYLRFNSDWNGYWSDYSNLGYDTTATPGWVHNLPNNGNVAIAPYSVGIYSQ